MKNIKDMMMAMGMVATMTACTGTPKSIDQQVDELYAKMTPGEQLAQLHGVYMGELFDENDKLDTAKCKALIPNGAGHFSQFCMNTSKTPDELRDMVMQMQAWLKENTPNGIPALFHEEVLSGVNTAYATIYPQQIGLACSFNPELAEQKTHETAVGLRKMGGFMALSPMVDVVRDPSFNRLEESYGEDGYLSAVMGVAFVKGLQHGDLHKGVAATTKHFLGYGGGGDANEKELMEEILLPHEAIIRLADSHSLMPGYHAMASDGIKCVANSGILQGILRDYLKFDGIVVSDYGAIEQIDDSMTDLQRAAAAINAGNDVDFPKGDSYRYLPEAMEQGLVSQETFERAVKRVLKFKFMLGLFDKDVPLYSTEHIQLDTDEERQTAYELATQSVVLLKNNGVLPLCNPLSKSAEGDKMQQKRIFLTGPNANTMWAMCGDYSYPAMRYFWKSSIEDGSRPHIVSLYEGMMNNMPSDMVLSYNRGCDWTEEVETIVESSGDPRTAYLVNIQNRMIDSGEEANWDMALKMAAENDVIVAAVGENAILCGENRDRKHLRLPGRQEEYVRALINTGKPVVLVVFGGRAQVLGDLVDKCAAVIQAWYPGEEGGNALANIFYGNVSPSGKLSVTYPAVELHEQICYNYGLEGDSRVAFPFGYGLTYTNFEYSNLKIESGVSTSAERFKVSVDVKNTGKFAATEIVQLYVSPIERSAKLKPIQLQGFKRVKLELGQCQTITLALSPQQLGYYVNGHWAIDPGRYMIKVGASSQDIRQQGEVVLQGEPQEIPLRTAYFAE